MKTEKGDSTPTTEHFFKRMKLQTASDIFAAQSKLIRLAAMGKITTDRLRALTYSLNMLLNALEAKKTEEVEDKRKPKPVAIVMPGGNDDIEEPAEPGEEVL